MRSNHVYADHASTSFPKPVRIWEAMQRYGEQIGVSPDRSGSDRQRLAAAEVQSTRQRVADLIAASDASTISFCAGATMGLNFAIKGHLRPGDHVVTTAAEHNSVLRPLEALRRQGAITYTVVAVSPEGDVDDEELAAAVRPNTHLFAVNHVSNVTGARLPIEKIGTLAASASIPLLLDCSQSAGILDIDVEAWNVSYAAFSGHKGLMGPSGIGCLFVRDPDLLDAIVEGGTGGNSHSLIHPLRAPWKFEAGTLNYLGIAGLGAALEELTARGRDRSVAHANALANRVSSALAGIPGVVQYGPSPRARQVPIIAFRIEGTFPGEVAAQLDRDFGIVTRPGLQCAPLMHKAMGTFPQGTVRLSFAGDNTDRDAERTIEAIEHCANARKVAFVG